MSGELDEKSLMLGGHDARIKALEAGMTSANEKLDKIVAALERSRGSWKMLTVFGGALVGIVEVIEALKGVFHIGGHP
jgi:hypothetical protein